MQIQVTYTYSYEVDETQFEDQVELQIQLGVTAEGQLVLSFDRLSGSLINYKKILSDLKKGCLQ